MKFAGLGARAEAIDSSIIAQQKIDTACHAASHRMETVTALLYHHQPPIAQLLRQLNDNLGQASKPCCRDVHLTKRIVPVSIKACRNQDQLGIKTIARRGHHLSKYSLVSLIAYI